MDDGGPTAGIIFFIALLLIDIFFYGFWEAVQTLNIKELQEKTDQKDKKVMRLGKIIENPTGFVNTLQLCVTLNNVVMGSFYLGIWLKYIHNFLAGRTGGLLGAGTISILSLIVTTFILMYVILTVGVLLPKRIAGRFPNKWALTFVNAVYYVMKALRPLTGLVTVTANMVVRIFGIKPDAGMSDVTEEEIISMVNEGHEQGVLQASEAEMITNIFEFGDKEAKDIMTNRKNIIALDNSMPLKDAMTFMLSQKNSRYPVYNGNIDHIVGILYMKDALRLCASNEALNAPIGGISELIREAKFIPETRNIDILFQNMQSLKIQMVIVVDEYGQTSGLIAMEDILEEIVGNIMDEYDEDTSYIEETGDNQYEIEGMTPLEDLEERFGISFEEENFDTLNGFLISKMDKIPDEGEEFEIAVSGYEFKVLSVKNKMIQSVLVTKLPEKSETEEQKETEE